MTNHHTIPTNGHVNPFYLEIEEEHDDDELSDYEDGVEQAGLLRTTPSSSSRASSRTTNSSPTTTSNRKRYRRICLFLVVVLAVLALKWNRKITPGGSEGEKLIPSNEDDDDVNDDDDDDDTTINNSSNHKDSATDNRTIDDVTKDTPKPVIDTTSPNSNHDDQHSCFQNGDSPIRLPTKDGALRYACLCSFDNSTIPATHSIFPDHSAQILSSNMTRFMKTYRHMEMDNWGHSYVEVKNGMHDWIATRYAEYLTDNSLIYDSSIGEGLHLHMVLNILLERKQIRNITVYGNHLSAGSVQVATAMGQQGYFPAGGKLGTICQGDSTQLQFVPSESFDLVFTAYIPPLSDPLHLSDSSQNDKLNAYYLTLCKKAENKDEAAMKEKREAQHQQDRWYAQWLSELVRVAKKGAPIIVEHISYPFCEATFDWGGVSKDFWTQATENKGFNLDSSSLVFEDDKLFRKRYHMFVRKNL